VDGKTKRTMEKFMPGWQFKNLTIDSKIFYSSMICILFWFMLIILNGCTSSIYKVRKEYIKGYDPYYNIYNSRYYYDYYPYNYNYNNTNYIRNNMGSGFGIRSINPTTQIKVPSSNKLQSNTSGFTGKPVASNPVTNSGGTKKKN